MPDKNAAPEESPIGVVVTTSADGKCFINLLYNMPGFSVSMTLADAHNYREVADMLASTIKRAGADAAAQERQNTNRIVVVQDIPDGIKGKRLGLN